MQQRIYPIYLTIFIQLLMIMPAANAKTVRALFIGNSYVATNNIPSIVSDLAASTGDELVYDAVAPGGTTFQTHSSSPATLALIAAGNWDYVILQEQSQRPAFPDEQVEMDVYPYARKLDSLVKHYNPCAKTMFYMTWGRKNGDAMNCAFYPSICTYEGMDSLLQLRYSNMADSNDALLAPVAAAWHSLRNTNPEIELYVADESHPSYAGSYLAAATFYTMLFQKNPELCSYNGTLSAGVATTIRQTTKAVVYDSMAHWSRYYPSLAAGFDFSIEGSTVSFTDLSQHADSVRWIFGDGNTSSAAAPEHTYSGEGTFEVMQIAYKCNDTDTARSTVEIGTTSLGNLNGSIKLTLYPNPAAHSVELMSSVAIKAINVYDFFGRQIAIPVNLSNQSCNLSIGALASGQYSVVIFTAKGFASKTFIKL